MASVVRIKRSAVAGKRPTTSNIETGELALNLTDGRLYSSDGSVIFEIGSNPGTLTVGDGTFSIANGAITFPESDGTSGQVLSTDGSGTISWSDAGSGGGTFTFSSTAPSSPSAGDVWVDSDDGIKYTYITDGDTSQWVELETSSNYETGANYVSNTDFQSFVANTNSAISASGGSVTVYSSIDSLPLSGNDAGDQAFVSENNRLYLWTGDGWYNIALVNTSPSIQANSYSSSYTLSTEGANTTVTLIASDPEGVPITWTYANSGLGSIATISQSNNVFTITPTSNTELGGTFSVTFKASDGVNLASATSEFTLNFVTSVENSNYTTALITSVGSNNGTNGSITDGSTNSHTITVSGQTSAQTFSPYRQGGYSYYFDGSGDYLNTTISAIGTDDFTFECWANFEALGANRVLFSMGGYSPSLYYRHASTEMAVYHGNAFYLSGFTPEINTWYHFAFTREGTTSRLFVNGTQYGGSSYSTNITETTARIGYDGIDYMKGWISDARIVVGTAVYTSDFTPPTERLEAITNTELLTCHLPYIKDGSSNDYSITLTGDVSAKPFAPYDYYEYDAATHGGSIFFDGSYDYHDQQISAIGTSDFTLEFWAYHTVDQTGEDGIFSLAGAYGAGSAHVAGLFFGRFHNAYCAMAGSAASTDVVNTYSDGDIPIGSWYHIAICRSSGTTTLYYNGTAIRTVSDSVNYTNTYLRIGSYYSTNTGLQGYVSDFRIVIGTAVYTADFTPPTEPLTAISGTELLISGTDASIIDKSQSTQITLSGDTKSSTTQTKYGSSSIYFDGTGDYIRDDAALEGITSSTPFTIEAWVYPTSNLGGTGTDSMDFIGINTLASGSNTLTLGNRIVRKNSTTYDSTDLSLDQWHHIAYVYDGSNSKYYINGSLDITISGTVDNLEDCSLLIGAEADAANAGSLGNYFNGYLEDVRITKGLARYTSNFTPPTAALEG